MTHWALVFRVRKTAATGLMPKPLKRDVASVLRVEKAYAASFSGVRLVGFDIRVKDEEFHHVIKVIRLLERRHDLALFELSARDESSLNYGISVKLVSKPTLNVC